LGADFSTGQMGMFQSALIRLAIASFIIHDRRRANRAHNQAFGARLGRWNAAGNTGMERVVSAVAVGSAARWRQEKADEQRSSSIRLLITYRSAPHATRRCLGTIEGFGT